jgi:poly-beta-1,6-N-acetyl-D-glucosamine synthase
MPADGRIVAVIPAWNEGASIRATLEGLRRQTLAPDRIIVVPNNCTDDTAAQAIQGGAEVYDIPRCDHKKAGALNRFFETHLFDVFAENDLFLVMDADTVLREDFIHNAVAHLRRAPTRKSPVVHAVGAVFTGVSGGGILGQLQRNEYMRFARWVAARRDRRAAVLSGTATMFTATALRAVHRGMQDGTLPGRGYLYCIDSRTEDHFLTLCLHALDLHAIAPADCRVVTDVMPSLSALWHQRLRWQQGTVEDLRAFGYCRVTRGTIHRQAAMGLVTAFTALYWGGFAPFEVWRHGPGVLNPLAHPWWLAAGGMIIFERTFSVRALGWKALAVAGAVVIEFAFDVFRQAVYATALWRCLRRSQITWRPT